MSSTGFLSTSNVEMLWNIIIDNVIQGNESNVTELQTIFHTHLIPFFGSEGKNTNDLIVLNKKYISWFINHLNRKNQDIKNTNDKLITVEDIHKNRQSQFEQELNEKQQEFTSYMTLKPPEVPKFSIDLNGEVPIKEFENTIKQMTAQRNYDVDIMNKNNNNNPSDVQTWLKPEKYTRINGVDGINRVKQIKIDTINLDSSQHNNIVDLNKHITWEDQMPPENNIFSKLKKINVTDINNNNNEIITNLQNNIHDMQNKMNDMNNSITQIFKLLNKNE